jgi:hypothetical protein
MCDRQNTISWRKTLLFGCKTTISRGKTVIANDKILFPEGKTPFAGDKTHFAHDKTYFAGGKTSSADGKTLFSDGKTAFSKRKTSFSARGRIASRLLRVANEWRSLLDAEQKIISAQATASREIPNPFVFGNPVTETETHTFAGRQDIVNKIEASILGAAQSPILLLHGPRRMGKLAHTRSPNSAPRGRIASSARGASA